MSGQDQVQEDDIRASAREPGAAPPLPVRFDDLELTQGGQGSLDKIPVSSRSSTINAVRDRMHGSAFAGRRSGASAERRFVAPPSGRYTRGMTAKNVEPDARARSAPRRCPRAARPVSASGAAPGRCPLIRFCKGFSIWPNSSKIRVKILGRDPDARYP